MEGTYCLNNHHRVGRHLSVAHITSIPILSISPPSSKKRYLLFISQVVFIPENANSAVILLYSLYSVSLFEGKVTYNNITNISCTKKFTIEIGKKCGQNLC